MIKISDRQRRFVEEYVKDFNIAQAAMRAGYSSNYAYRRANTELLGNVGVIAYMEEIRNKVQTSTQITLEKVVAEYAKIAFLDVRKLYDDRGAVKPISEIDDDTAAAITNIKVASTQISNEVIASTIEVKLSDKRAALDAICRIMGYNAPEKHEHAVSKFEGFNFLPTDAE